MVSLLLPAEERAALDLAYLARSLIILALALAADLLLEPKLIAMGWWALARCFHASVLVFVLGGSWPNDRTMMQSSKCGCCPVINTGTPRRTWSSAAIVEAAWLKSPTAKCTL